jgi:hypothetical protein
MARTKQVLIETVIDRVTKIAPEAESACTIKTALLLETKSLAELYHPGSAAA